MFPEPFKAESARKQCAETNVGFTKSRDNKVYHALKSIYDRIKEATKQYPPKYEIIYIPSKDEEKYQCMSIVCEELKKAGYVVFTVEEEDNEDQYKISWEDQYKTSWKE